MHDHGTLKMQQFTYRFGPIIRFTLFSGFTRLSAIGIEPPARDSTAQSENSRHPGMKYLPVFLRLLNSSAPPKNGGIESHPAFYPGGCLTPGPVNPQPHNLRRRTHHGQSVWPPFIRSFSNNPRLFRLLHSSGYSGPCRSQSRGHRSHGWYQITWHIAAISREACLGIPTKTSH